tara:strand:- start:2798 stop:3091 length:294 start_codon:yes stop_codon:yes gene_type:complete
MNVTKMVNSPSNIFKHRPSCACSTTLERLPRDFFAKTSWKCSSCGSLEYFGFSKGPGSRGIYFNPNTGNYDKASDFIRRDVDGQEIYKTPQPSKALN